MNSYRRLVAALCIGLFVSAGGWAADKSSKPVDKAVKAEKVANLSGEWKLNVETQQGSGKPTLTLNQQGDKLLGTYHSGRLGEAPVKGTVSGNAFKFTATGKADGQEVKMNFDGKLDGDAISGTIEMGGLGGGKFSGTRG